MLCGLRVSFWDAWNRTDKEVAQLCGRTGLTKCAGLGAWKGKVVNFLLVKSTTIKKKNLNNPTMDLEQTSGPQGLGLRVAGHWA